MMTPINPDVRPTGRALERSKLLSCRRDVWRDGVLLSTVQTVTEHLQMRQWALVAALVVGTGWQSAPAQQADADRGVLLVQVEQDLDELFARAREAVKAGEPIKAVELLQSLIIGDRNLFYPHAEDPRRYQRGQSVIC
jgi:hypothetical protein